MKQNKYLTKQNKQKRSKTLIAWMKALENVQIWWKQKRMDTNINQTKRKKKNSARLVYEPKSTMGNIFN